MELHKQLKVLCSDMSINKFAHLIKASTTFISRAERNIKITQNLLNKYNNHFGTNFKAPLKKCETCDNQIPGNKTFCVECVRQRNLERSREKYNTRKNYKKQNYIPTKRQTDRERLEMQKFSERVIAESERLARENRPIATVVIPKGARVIDDSNPRFTVIMTAAGYRECVNACVGVGE